MGFSSQTQQTPGRLARKSRLGGDFLHGLRGQPPACDPAIQLLLRSAFVAQHFYSVADCCLCLMRQSLLAAIHQTGDIGGNLGFTEGMDFAFPAD